MNPQSPPFNILFTSAGRRVELFRSFRRAYEELGLPGRIFATDIDPLAPALQVADAFYIVPRLEAPEYVQTLRDICVREGIRLIFPLIDPDVPILACHRRVIEQTGARLAVIPSESIDIVGDKWLTYQFFKRIGLPTPISWLPEDSAVLAQPFPLFIKPRRGSASHHTFKIQNRKELDFFSEYVQDGIIQEFLPGPEITTDLVCDLDGKVLTVVSRQRIEVRSGEVAKGVTVDNAFIETACRKIAQSLPAIGPITVQCILKESHPYFTEINARIGGGFPLGIMAGADSLKLLLARMAGLPIDTAHSDRYVSGLYFTRYDDAFFLSQVEYEQIRRRHL
ncbi:MAG: ATP-grasp domain-containing protein [Nitrospira sp.]